MRIVLDSNNQNWKFSEILLSWWSVCLVNSVNERDLDRL